MSSGLTGSPGNDIPDRALPAVSQAGPVPSHEISGRPCAGHSDGRRTSSSATRMSPPSRAAKRRRSKPARAAWSPPDAIVIATNTPINNMVTIHTKQAAYISYVIGAAMPPGRLNPRYFGIRSIPTTMCDCIADRAEGRRETSSSSGVKTIRPGRPTTAEARYARLGGLGTGAFSHDGGCDFPLVRASDGVCGRPGLHRSESRRRGQRLHCNRRLRHGDDPRHDCRTADH